MDKTGLTDPDDALQVIVGSVQMMGAESVGLACSLDRVIAEDVVAWESIPGFDNSAVDGYAVISECTCGASASSPKSLLTIATEPAGTVAPVQITPGTAVRIMTGAAMPRGADAVVKIEDTATEGDTVSISHEAAPGANVRRAGEDVKKGDLVICKGTRIGPAQMGMLAALGKGDVSVHTRPRAAIVTTGTEIVDVWETVPPGRIRDSNMHSLIGQVIRSGAQVSLLARVADERNELGQVLQRGADVSDVVITSGGVSVGDYDFVKDTISALGEIQFWGVAIKPGKPLAFGSIKGKPLFGLPGNPVSSMVTFDLFVRPALRRMSGIGEIGHSMVTGVICQDVKHKQGRREYVRCRLAWNGSGYWATPTGDQGSARLSSMLDAEAYAVIPESAGDIESGASVDILVLN